MSAFKQNPFLIGFTVVMVLGVGALGYLTYSAASEHEKAQTEYNNAADELKRLQTLKPFPSDENLAKYVEQKKEVQAKVDALQKELASIKIKVEDISPSEFQVKLRDTVGRVSAKAAESNVTLPGTDKDKFYLGFNLYQGEPPKAPAAPLLYRELRAIEAVMNIIIETKNVVVKELSRSELKEERNPKATTVDPNNPGKGGKGGKGEEGQKLVSKEGFTLKFSTTQENFQRILNGIVSNKEQFFIPRYVVVENEKKDPPPKNAIAGTPPPPPPPGPDNATNGTPPAAPAPPAAEKLEYIFGKEMVEVTMDLELVDVREPDTAAPEKAGRK